MLWIDLPQSTFFDGPAEVGPHQAVLLRAVDWVLFAVSVGQSVFACALKDEVNCLIEGGSCRDTMQRGEVSEILVWRGSIRFGDECGPLLLREKWLLRAGKNGGGEEGTDEETPHRPTRITNDS